MLTPDKTRRAHPPTLVVEGDRYVVGRLHADDHAADWHEAWQIHDKEDTTLGVRYYLALVKVDNRFGLGFASIDDKVLADVEAAGLPKTLAVAGRVLVLLPDWHEDEDLPEDTAASWVCRHVARRIATGVLPVPPALEFEVEQWRTVLGVLVDMVELPFVRAYLTANSGYDPE